ncbi:MAG: hypothetical protein ACFFBL_09200 [Promethearchaeota archaeon]
MISRKTLVVIVAVGLLLLGATPRSVSADITGKIYNFSAVWFDQKYQVDNAIVLDETIQGNFQIQIVNITPSDLYQYTFRGFNYYPWSFAPHYDEFEGFIDFQDNKVSFDLNSIDFDANNLTEGYFLDMSPYFIGSHPGTMFFVNPVWSTHNTDWTIAVEDAETQPGLISLTESATEGSFSFQIRMGFEQNHSDYNYMTGEVTLTFNAAYDNDGVLSSWSLQQVRSRSNENHTVIDTVSQSFARGTGAGALLQPSLIPALAIAGGLGVGGLILGVAIGRKYWG